MLQLLEKSPLIYILGIIKCSLAGHEEYLQFVIYILVHETTCFEVGFLWGSDRVTEAVMSVWRTNDAFDSFRERI